VASEKILILTRVSASLRLDRGDLIVNRVSFSNIQFNNLRYGSLKGIRNILARQIHKNLSCTRFFDINQHIGTPKTLIKKQRLQNKLSLTCFYEHLQNCYRRHLILSPK
jgi:hypothetical protein